MPRILICFVVLMLSGLCPALADRLPDISDRTRNMEKYRGFFTFYREAETGRLWLEIERFGQEFLYINWLASGLGSNDVGLDRGMPDNTRVVYFDRIGQKIMLVEPNQRYRATTSNAAEKRAVEESFAQSILWSFEAEAEEDDRVLVDATEFLLRDACNVTKVLKSRKQGLYRTDFLRSAIYFPRTKSFPQNTEFEATVTFTGGDESGSFVNSVVPSPEAITLRQHHSFVQLPDNNYRPRPFDVRAGYFNISYYDYSTPISEPIEKRFIARHRLNKKNPEQPSGEAVKPIVYYVDNGAPEPIRSALMEGARWWNQAFEAAGYKNAFRVEMMPEDADPLDVRYNTIQWIHRSTRGWSIGHSIVDPRTGEIIKGHVSLGSLRMQHDYLIAEGLLAPYRSGRPLDPANDPMLKMALTRLRQLAAHELGHTLGLMHNYAASFNNRASVMDYPHPKITIDSAGNISLADAYTAGLGEWDKQAIIYGYQDFPKGTDEKKALSDVLRKLTASGLKFISDADTRTPSSAHPYSHVWDNGNEPILELYNLLIIRKKALTNFSANNIRTDAPMATLEEVLVPLYNLHRYQVEAVTKLVGGLNYSYALRDDGQLVTEIIPGEVQRKAVEAALHGIAPEILTLPEPVIKLIPPRPVGYGSTPELFARRTGLTFDPLSAAEAMADYTMYFLLHPERAARLVEYSARGTDTQQNYPGLDEVIRTIISRTWKSPRSKGLQAEVERQTEQVVLTHLLALSVNENTSMQARAIAARALAELKEFITAQKAKANDPGHLAHLEYALERMKSPDKTKIKIHKELPPGAPIGLACE